MFVWWEKEMQRELVSERQGRMVVSWGDFKVGQEVGGDAGQTDETMWEVFDE